MKMNIPFYLIVFKVNEKPNKTDQGGSKESRKEKKNKNPTYYQTNTETDTSEKMSNITEKNKIKKWEAFSCRNELYIWF